MAQRRELAAEVERINQQMRNMDPDQRLASLVEYVARTNVQQEATAHQHQQLMDQQVATNGLQVALNQQVADHQATTNGLQVTLNQQMATLQAAVQGLPAAGPAGPPRGRLPNLTFEGKEGEDWVLFKAGFLNAAKFEGYVLANAKRALKSCMRGSALLATEVVEHEDAGVTLEAMLARYEEIFLPPAASTMAITKFETAVQGPKETVMAYHSRLASLFARAHPEYAGAGVPDGLKDKMLIRRFYQGLRKQKLREEIQRRSPADYNAALAAAQAEVAILDGSNLLHLGMGGAEPMDISALGLEVGGINAMDRNLLKCHNCQQAGHVWRECTRPISKAGEARVGEARKPKGFKKTNPGTQKGKGTDNRKEGTKNPRTTQQRAKQTMAAMAEEWEALTLAEGTPEEKEEGDEKSAQEESPDEEESSAEETDLE